MWYQGVRASSSFFSTVSFTGPLRVEWVPFTASTSTSRARSYAVLQNLHRTYPLWMMLKDRG